MLTCYFDDQLRSVVGASRHVFDFAKCEHAIDDLAEHDMLPVEEFALVCGYEELTAIRVWTGVGLQSVGVCKKTIQIAYHRQKTCARMFLLEIFILCRTEYPTVSHNKHCALTNREVLSVYREGASAITVYEITACQRWS